MPIFRYSVNPKTAPSVNGLSAFADNGKTQPLENSAKVAMPLTALAVLGWFRDSGNNGVR